MLYYLKVKAFKDNIIKKGIYNEDINSWRKKKSRFFIKIIS